MKQDRKEILLHSFPCIPEDVMKQMKGRQAANFVVFLSHGRELFARCYHRYSNGKLVERQRYVFAEDGSVRYLLDRGDCWCVSKEFREPVFSAHGGYAYTMDNQYQVLNYEALKKSCMRYADIKDHTPYLLIEWLHLYCKHPNIEYIVKSGYDCLIKEVVTGYWGGARYLRASPCINWKSDNVLKMLNLNRTEFKLLKGNEALYERYCEWRKNFPNYTPHALLALSKEISYKPATVEKLCRLTGLSISRIADYVGKNRLYFRDYEDYIDQCEKLGYNLKDTAICLPRNFNAKHERTTAIIEYEHNQEMRKQFAELVPSRKSLEYQSEDYIVIQPKSIDDIVNEGKTLEHCVGGYANRHAEGKLHIMFLRLRSEPDKPYYTIEVDTNGRIVQCRGYKNNVTISKPQEITDFEKTYQNYLNGVFAKKNKKARKTA